MCCFSGAATVANTSIFARLTGDGRQYLVYEMTVTAQAEMAMILPLPVPPDTAEDSVHFLNLESYRRFFRDLDRAFPVSRSLASRVAPVASAAPLRVVSVGSFEASFVPRLADFARLDTRFRLPENVWQQMPNYQEYGFAVFKLKPGAMTVHPMAFLFPTREPEQLFFPTVHIHDGRVHRRAAFDHSLYCQTDEGISALQNWQRSSGALAQFVALAQAQGIFDPAQSCYKLRLQGTYRNQDIWIPETSGGTLWRQFVGWFSPWRSR
ncbi:MAG: hypothetical protein U0Y68_00350 [Blastocatellia bacterium]